MADRLDPPIEQLLREMAPQVLSPVVRRFRDFAAAEDAVQEALIAATEQWPRDGVPANPRGWLIQVASRRMTDHIRSEVARRRREQVAAEEAERLALQVEGAAETVDDDTLELLFMCCHPALTPASAIALILRAVGGLTTAEIANAFLVPEATMAQRISRAKQAIKSAGASFTLPPASERAVRLRVVLQVLYLVFNQGYTELLRTDLTAEAVRLRRLLYRLLPEGREVAGLLALMLLTDARRAARIGDDGLLVPLAEQRRELWDTARIEEGVALLTQTLGGGPPGPYQVQAAIAAV